MSKIIDKSMEKKSKVNMPNDIKMECAKVIHIASAAAGSAALIPIPIADRIPITAAQVGMIISLGKVFDITISNSVANAVIGCGLAQNIGQALSDSIIKVIPGVNFVAPAICTITASGLTEAMGWIVADDFYRMSIGEKPENIIKEANKIKDLFDKTSKDKKTKTKVKKRKVTKKS